MRVSDDGINAARADRFLNEARRHSFSLEINLSSNSCRTAVRNDSYENSIRHQQSIGDVERLISPKCIFDWVKNMSLEKAHHVFYDEDRAEDYKGLDPDKPKDGNCYEPFLSPKFLTEILTKMES